MSTLVTVTGLDHPGVTAALMDVLTRHGATVEDIEQVVVHGRLLLGVPGAKSDELMVFTSVVGASPEKVAEAIQGAAGQRGGP